MTNTWDWDNFAQDRYEYVLREMIWTFTQLTLEDHEAPFYDHSEDDGDRYDEVSGVYWSVDGMYELSEAGKKMKEYVSRKSFVMFG